MPSTALMWFRRDLRVHDLPALAGAARADRLVPVFVFDDRLLRTGRFPSANRTAFMLGCLRELDAELRDRGAGLAIRHGRPEREIPALAREVDAEDVYFTADSSPWSRRRDQQVIDALAADGVRAHASPGAFVVDDPSNLRTGQDKPYTVFTPFHRTWENEGRREPATTPRKLSPPSGLRTGRMPSLSDLGVVEEPDLPFEPGEKAARRAMSTFLREPVKQYDDLHDRAAGGTSRLSPYLRWGCLSPLELEEKAAEQRGAGAAAFVRQLAWRDFYAAVLMHFPFVVGKEFQEKYRDLEWARKSQKLDAWKQGRTGYPFVDAGMRQLVAEGWMHNRLRLVVGSFLTKDLHLDWRLGEAFFME
ncbi:MAG TPA: deoxyribodipyrimidine photo-lyase, partial [Thermoleophilaceae bacterium]|nr:deoxyribodipyrimidine photo-lyase [Thermoleophilaceae bacterium]